MPSTVSFSLSVCTPHRRKPAPCTHQSSDVRHNCRPRREALRTCIQSCINRSGSHPSYSRGTRQESRRKMPFDQRLLGKSEYLLQRPDFDRRRAAVARETPWTSSGYDLELCLGRFQVCLSRHDWQPGGARSNWRISSGRGRISTV